MHPLSPYNACLLLCPALQVSKKSKLTKLAFNAKHPVMLVGDDRCVSSVPQVHRLGVLRA